MTAGVGRQKTSYSNSFYFMFIMVHRECVLHVLYLTTSVSRYKARLWYEILVQRDGATSLSHSNVLNTRIISTMFSAIVGAGA